MNIFIRTDCMRAVGSFFGLPMCSKKDPGLKLFFVLHDAKMHPVHKKLKMDQKQLFIFSSNSRGQFYNCIFSIEKNKILGNPFIYSQFKYAPFLWMFCRKNLYLKIKKIHHKTLKVIHQSNDTYGNLLLQSITVPVHQRYLRFLMTEVYKSISQLNPEFMWSYFMRKYMPYNLRKSLVLGLPKTHSFYYGMNAVY